MMHPGQPVLLAPSTGRGLPSYAMVAVATSPHTVRIVITASSGGRERGRTYTMPRARLTQRCRGLHRRPRVRRRWWRIW